MQFSKRFLNFSKPIFDHKFQIMVETVKRYKFHSSSSANSTPLYIPQKLEDALSFVRYTNLLTNFYFATYVFAVFSIALDILSPDSLPNSFNGWCFSKIMLGANCSSHSLLPCHKSGICSKSVNKPSFTCIPTKVPKITVF